MKTVLLYGPGEVGKRNEALRIRKTFSPDNVTILDFKTEGLNKLLTELKSVPMFITGERLVVVENLPDNFDLNNLPESADLTLLLIAGIPPATSALLKSLNNKIKAIPFEGEREVLAFPFLDNLIEGKKQAFLELEKLMEAYSGMYVLTMIYYLLRRNFLPLPKSSFAAGKINNQKAKLKREDFMRLYKLTLDTEYAIKNGSLPENLALNFLVQKIIN